MFLTIFFLTGAAISAIYTPFYVRKPDDGSQGPFTVGYYGTLFPRPATPQSRLQLGLAVTGALLVTGLYCLWMTLDS